MVDEKQLIEEAIQLYSRTLAFSDPSRLEAWVGLGLTVTQIRVLYMLRQDGGAPAGFMAERLRVTPSTFTRIADRLARLGLVRRQEDEEDRRLVRHYLTGKGSETLAELERTGRAFLTEILRQLPKEKLERLLCALEDLSQAAEAVEAVEKTGVNGPRAGS